MTKLRAVHQFHVGSAYGDGVTNAMLFTRRLLRALGLRSEIYAVVIPPALQGDILPHTAFRSEADQLLLVHHSMGHELHGWIENVRAAKILVYHNITPPQFFTEHDPHRHQVILGRRQLTDWRNAGVFLGAIACSPLNAMELHSCGYEKLCTIPLLVDLERLEAAALQPAPHRDAVLDLLFVGRLTTHKGQLDLLSAYAELRRHLTCESRLTLVGNADPDYLARLYQLRDELGIERSTHITGPLTRLELYNAYRRADLFVCLSEHEGFGMPLIEAAAFGVPVVAYDAGNVADTVGDGALLLTSKEPQIVAEACRRMLEDPLLRRQVLAGQQRSLQRYRPEVLVAELAKFLLGLGLEIPDYLPLRPHAPSVVRIEGPFDSSYSLAIVNRELARGLERRSVATALRTTDDGGSRRPSSSFLKTNPDIELLWRRADLAPASAVLLNAYPPDVMSMGRAPLRALACYAWEETGFPGDYVDAFNRGLDLITVTSKHVRKVLVDNGVRTPIRVVGNGVDQILQRPGRASAHPLPEGFRFLHVSSCFPRKGVDVLLAAWARAFRSDENVALVIKGFPNPHNTVAEQLEALTARDPGHAPVTFINADLEADEIRGLYESCHALVAPSRCEGFGLPLAEAMLLGLPVVTVSFSGQADFCTDETAWLADWRFALSESHLGVPHSAWAEPDVDDLARQLRAVFDASPACRSERINAARRLIADRYTWDAVAQRVDDAMREIAQVPATSFEQTRLAWVSTWNSRCGIASYSEALTQAVPAAQLRIFANDDTETLETDGPDVERSWRADRQDDLSRLHASIARFGANSVMFQFNFGFFDLKRLAGLLDRLVDEGRDVFVTFHSTADVDKPGLKASLGDIAYSLARVKRLLVHSIVDLNRLKAFGLVENVTLFPHGFPEPVISSAAATARSRLVGQGEKLIATFGYLLPHKGLKELLMAFAQLRAEGLAHRLLMLNALYPAWESEAERTECVKLVEALELREAVVMHTDFLPEEEALALLSAADVVVYPYQQTQESASGAVRLGIASLRPVAVTPLSIFDDIAPVTYRLSGTTPECIAEGLRKLLSEGEGRPLPVQAEWVRQLSWSNLSRRVWNLTQAA